MGAKPVSLRIKSASVNGVLVFGAPHCHAGDVTSAPGNGDVAVAQLATGCMLEKWRYHGTLLR